MFRVLDLFSGIGGFSLGLERTGGFETVAFCEIDPFCRRVLAKHWPKVPCYDDVRELTAARLAADGIAVDVICGGFPCQDVSFAGKRAGLEGARSGLWSEYGRLIGEVRPQFVIVENVPGLLNLGMGTVLGDLSALRYDAVWDSIPALAVGAPHRRDRVWIIAHPSSQGRWLQSVSELGSRGTAVARDDDGQAQPMAHADRAGCKRSRPAQPKERQRDLVPTGGGTAVAHANERDQYWWGGAVQMGRLGRAGETAHDGHAGGTEWGSEPDVGRVAHGVPARVDRLRSLGNAVVPQIPEMIGRAILDAVA